MYIVEGNMGVGKSTFLNIINKHNPQIPIIPEPKAKWLNESFGQSLLEKFYKNSPRWSYTMETFTLICRIQNHLQLQQNPNPHILIERSIYSGYYCFAKNSYASGSLTNLEWKIYNKWINFLFKKCSPPLGFIYLRAEPEVCYERAIKRNRSAEKTLTLDYFKQIHLWHERFLVGKKDVFDYLKTVPVLTIECNEDFSQNPSIIEEYSKKVQLFYAGTTKRPHSTPRVELNR